MRRHHAGLIDHGEKVADDDHAGFEQSEPRPFFLHVVVHHLAFGVILSVIVPGRFIEAHPRRSPFDVGVVDVKDRAPVASEDGGGN